MDLRSQLRTSTSDSHVSIEKNPRLARLTSPSLDVDGYFDVMKRYYGFFSGLEADLLASPFALPDMRTRVKTPALVSDLAVAGISIDELPVCSDVPLVRSRAEVLGVMYVLEGSALGGMQIAKHLAAFPFTRGRSSFFVSDGAAVSARWKSFLTFLEDVPESEWSSVCSSATRTFESLDRWMAGS
jgi:heme oxygenase